MTPPCWGRYSAAASGAASGAPGETVTVAVSARDGVVRGEVTDGSGPGVPELQPAGRDLVSRRGSPDGAAMLLELANETLDGWILGSGLLA